MDLLPAQLPAQLFPALGAHGYWMHVVQLFLLDVVQDLPLTCSYVLLTCFIFVIWRDKVNEKSSCYLVLPSAQSVSHQTEADMADVVRIGHQDDLGALIKQ